MDPLGWLGGVSYVLSHDQFQGKFRPVSSQNRIFLTAISENCTWTPNPSWAFSASCILPGNKDSQTGRVDDIEDGREFIWSLLELSWSCRDPSVCVLGMQAEMPEEM